MNLLKLIGYGNRAHIAIVGAGGKSSLLSYLSREFRKSDKKVIVSTTTKVWKHQVEGYAKVVLQNEEGWKEELFNALQNRRLPFIAERVLSDGKLKGISGDKLDQLFLKAISDIILVEADGAKGYPIKAPENFEPVIPKTVTTVIGLIGLDAVGKRVKDGVVFRKERFKEITSLKDDDHIGADSLCRLILHPDGLFKGAPIDSQKVVFLNKLDIFRGEDSFFKYIRSNIGKEHILIAGSIKEEEIYPIDGEDL